MHTFEQSSRLLTVQERKRKTLIWTCLGVCYGNYKLCEHCHLESGFINIRRRLITNVCAYTANVNYFLCTQVRNICMKCLVDETL